MNNGEHYHTVPPRHQEMLQYSPAIQLLQSDDYRMLNIDDHDDENTQQEENSVSATNSKKRKVTTRYTARACDFCKYRHLRCDGLDHCFQCSKRSQPCTYTTESGKRGPKPKKQKTQQFQIQQQLLQHQRQLQQPQEFQEHDDLDDNDHFAIYENRNSFSSNDEEDVTPRISRQRKSRNFAEIENFSRISVPINSDTFPLNNISNRSISPAPPSPSANLRMSARGISSRSTNEIIDYRTPSMVHCQLILEIFDERISPMNPNNFALHPGRALEIWKSLLGREVKMKLVELIDKLIYSSAFALGARAWGAESSAEYFIKNSEDVSSDLMISTNIVPEHLSQYADNIIAALLMQTTYFIESSKFCSARNSILRAFGIHNLHSTVVTPRVAYRLHTMMISMSRSARDINHWLCHARDIQPEGGTPANRVYLAVCFSTQYFLRDFKNRPLGPNFHFSSMIGMDLKQEEKNGYEKMMKEFDDTEATVSEYKEQQKGVPGNSRNPAEIEYSQEQIRSFISVINGCRSNVIAHCANSELAFSYIDRCISSAENLQGSGIFYWPLGLSLAYAVQVAKSLDSLSLYERGMLVLFNFPQCPLILTLTHALALKPTITTPLPLYHSTNTASTGISFGNSTSNDSSAGNSVGIAQSSITPTTNHSSNHSAMINSTRKAFSYSHITSPSQNPPTSVISTTPSTPSSGPSSVNPSSNIQFNSGNISPPHPSSPSRSLSPSSYNTFRSSSSASSSHDNSPSSSMTFSVFTYKIPENYSPNVQNSRAHSRVSSYQPQLPPPPSDTLSDSPEADSIPASLLKPTTPTTPSTVTRMHTRRKGPNFVDLSGGATIPSMLPPAQILPPAPPLPPTIPPQILPTPTPQPTTLPPAPPLMKQETANESTILPPVQTTQYQLQYQYQHQHQFQHLLHHHHQFSDRISMNSPFATGNVNDDNSDESVEVLKSNERTRGLPREPTRDQPREKPKEKSQEQLIEQSRELPREKPREQSKEREQSRENSIDIEISREHSREQLPLQQHESIPRKRKYISEAENRDTKKKNNNNIIRNNGNYNNNTSINDINDSVNGSRSNNSTIFQQSYQISEYNYGYAYNPVYDNQVQGHVTSEKQRKQLELQSQNNINPTKNSHSLQHQHQHIYSQSYAEIPRFQELAIPPPPPLPPHLLSPHSSLSQSPQPEQSISAQDLSNLSAQDQEFILSFLQNHQELPPEQLRQLNLQIQQLRNQSQKSPMHLKANPIQNHTTEESVKIPQQEQEQQKRRKQDTHQDDILLVRILTELSSENNPSQIPGRSPLSPNRDKGVCSLPSLSSFLSYSTTQSPLLSSLSPPVSSLSPSVSSLSPSVSSLSPSVSSSLLSSSNSTKQSTPTLSPTLSPLPTPPISPASSSSASSTPTTTSPPTSPPSTPTSNRNIPWKFRSKKSHESNSTDTKKLSEHAIPPTTPAPLSPSIVTSKRDELEQQLPKHKVQNYEKQQPELRQNLTENEQNKQREQLHVENQEQREQEIHQKTQQEQEHEQPKIQQEIVQDQAENEHEKHKKLQEGDKSEQTEKELELKNQLQQEQEV